MTIPQDQTEPTVEQLQQTEEEVRIADESEVPELVSNSSKIIEPTFKPAASNFAAENRLLPQLQKLSKAAFEMMLIVLDKSKSDDTRIRACNSLCYCVMQFNTASQVIETRRNRSSENSDADIFKRKRNKNGTLKYKNPVGRPPKAGGAWDDLMAPAPILAARRMNFGTKPNSEGQDVLRDEMRCVRQDCQKRQSRRSVHL